MEAKINKEKEKDLTSRDLARCADWAIPLWELDHHDGIRQGEQGFTDHLDGFL